MAGYSTTPLVKKLGIKPGFKVYLKNAPANYLHLIAPVPDSVRFATRLTANLDMVHFSASRNRS